VGVITFPYMAEHCNSLLCNDAHELLVFDIDDLGGPGDVFVANRKGWIFKVADTEQSSSEPIVLDGTFEIRGICERCYEKNGESPEYVFNMKVTSGVIASCEEVLDEEPDI